MTEKSVANFLKEIQILGPLKHPNIICMYGASWKVQQPEQMYILLEYAEGGTLEELLACPDISWKSGRKRLVSGIIKAMCYLHHRLKRPIIHRDLVRIGHLHSTKFKVIRYALVEALQYLNQWA